MVNLKLRPGGVKLPGYKHYSEGATIQYAGIPSELVLFLSQHTGAPSKPIVKPGDEVKRGQMIAEPGGFVSSSLHAPTSGKIKAIESRYHQIQGRRSEAIILESDGKHEVTPDIQAGGNDIITMSREDIIELARASGLVGLGGAAFPTAVKLSPPKDKPIDTYLLNGAECEPYLTSDQRLMVEEPDDIIFGFRAFLKATGVTKGIVCIEDNKPKAIAAMKKAVEPYPELDVAVLSHLYPRGGEKQLIQAVLGREVPPPPGLPLDVGVIVSNVGTAYAMAMAIKTGLPLVERIVTVTGPGVKTPSNFRTLLGTPVSYLIEKAGGLAGTPGKVILGGPMMGIAVKDLNVPVMKGTSGILVLRKEETGKEEVMPCIYCGKCVYVCPMRLLPVFMAAYVERGFMEEAEKARVMDCCECGSCAYQCPSKRPLTQLIRLGKAQIMEKRRALAKAGQK